MARRLKLRLYVSFSGSVPYIRNTNGFGLTLWKQRVDRFRGLDPQSYIDDGTIAGHFLLDEADDKSNWNGKIVPVELVEQLAAYSKGIWPTMPAIIRASTSYLANLPRQIRVTRRCPGAVPRPLRRPRSVHRGQHAPGQGARARRGGWAQRAARWR
jgi:hypothetical protein